MSTEKFVKDDVPILDFELSLKMDTGEGVQIKAAMSRGMMDAFALVVSKLAEAFYHTGIMFNQQATNFNDLKSALNSLVTTSTGTNTTTAPVNVNFTSQSQGTTFEGPDHHHFESNFVKNHVSSSNEAAETKNPTEGDTGSAQP